jgi:hypothetical protein
MRCLGDLGLQTQKGSDCLGHLRARVSYGALASWEYGVKYQIIKKSDSKLMRLIGWVLKPFNPNFMTHYVTTIGSTIYSPWEVIDEGLLQHELQHISDSKKFPVIYELSYLFIFPFGLTLRSFWEKRAYRHSIKVIVFLGIMTDDALVEWLLHQFTSSQYLWMDLRKKSVEKWIRAEIERVKAGHGVPDIEAERVQ